MDQPREAENSVWVEEANGGTEQEVEKKCRDAKENSLSDKFGAVVETEAARMKHWSGEQMCQRRAMKAMAVEEIVLTGVERKEGELIEAAPNCNLSNCEADREDVCASQEQLGNKPHSSAQRGKTKNMQARGAVERMLTRSEQKKRKLEEVTPGCETNIEEADTKEMRPPREQLKKGRWTRAQKLQRKRMLIDESLTIDLTKDEATQYSEWSECELGTRRPQAEATLVHVDGKCEVTGGVCSKLATVQTSDTVPGSEEIDLSNTNSERTVGGTDDSIPEGESSNLAGESVRDIPVTEEADVIWVEESQERDSSYVLTKLGKAESFVQVREGTGGTKQETEKQCRDVEEGSQSGKSGAVVQTVAGSVDGWPIEQVWQWTKMDIMARGESLFAKGKQNMWNKPLSSAQRLKLKKLRARAARGGVLTRAEQKRLNVEGVTPNSETSNGEGDGKGTCVGQEQVGNKPLSRGQRRRLKKLQARSAGGKVLTSEQKKLNVEGVTPKSETSNCEGDGKGTRVSQEQVENKPLSRAQRRKLKKIQARAAAGEVLIRSEQKKRKLEEVTPGCEINIEEADTKEMCPPEKQLKKGRWTRAQKLQRKRMLIDELLTIDLTKDEATQYSEWSECELGPRGPLVDATLCHVGDKCKVPEGVCSKFATVGTWATIPGSEEIDTSDKNSERVVRGRDNSVTEGDESVRDIPVTEEPDVIWVEKSEERDTSCVVTKLGEAESFVQLEEGNGGTKQETEKKCRDVEEDSQSGKSGAVVETVAGRMDSWSIEQVWQRTAMNVITVEESEFSKVEQKEQILEAATPNCERRFDGKDLCVSREQLGKKLSGAQRRKLRKIQAMAAGEVTRAEQNKQVEVPPECGNRNEDTKKLESSTVENIVPSLPVPQGLTKRQIRRLKQRLKVLNSKTSADGKKAPFVSVPLAATKKCVKRLKRKLKAGQPNDITNTFVQYASVSITEGNANSSMTDAVAGGTANAPVFKQIVKSRTNVLSQKVKVKGTKKQATGGQKRKFKGRKPRNITETFVKFVSGGVTGDNTNVSRTENIDEYGNTVLGQVAETEEETGVSLRVAVVPMGFPNVKMTEEQAEVVVTALENMIDPYDCEEPVQFSAVQYENGGLAFTCIDRVSKAWLHKTAPKIMPWLGACLTVGQADSILEGNKFVLLLPKEIKGRGGRQILDLIQKQNKGISTTKWKVLDRVPEADKLERLTLWVDKKSFEDMKARNLKLFIGLSLSYLSQGSEWEKLPADSCLTGWCEPQPTVQNPLPVHVKYKPLRQLATELSSQNFAQPLVQDSEPRAVCRSRSPTLRGPNPHLLDFGIEGQGLPQCCEPIFTNTGPSHIVTAQFTTSDLISPRESWFTESASLQNQESMFLEKEQPLECEFDTSEQSQLLEGSYIVSDQAHHRKLKDARYFASDCRHLSEMGYRTSESPELCGRMYIDSDHLLPCDNRSMASNQQSHRDNRCTVWDRLTPLEKRRTVWDRLSPRDKRTTVWDRLSRQDKGYTASDQLPPQDQQYNALDCLSAKGQQCKASDDLSSRGQRLKASDHMLPRDQLYKTSDHLSPIDQLYETSDHLSPIDQQDRATDRLSPGDQRYRASDRRSPSDRRYRASDRRSPGDGHYRASDHRSPLDRRYRASDRRSPLDRRYRASDRRSPLDRRYRASDRRSPLDRRYRASDRRSPLDRRYRASDRRSPLDRRYRASDRRSPGDRRYRASDRLSPLDRQYRASDRRSPGDRQYRALDRQSSGDRRYRVSDRRSPGDWWYRASDRRSPGDQRYRASDCLSLDSPRQTVSDHRPSRDWYPASNCSLSSSSGYVTPIQDQSPNSKFRGWDRHSCESRFGGLVEILFQEFSFKSSNQVQYEEDIFVESRLRMSACLPFRESDDTVSSRPQSWKESFSCSDVR